MGGVGVEGGEGGGGARDLVSFNGAGFPEIVGYKSDADHAPHCGTCRPCWLCEGQPDFLLRSLSGAPYGKLGFTHNIVGTGNIAIHDDDLEDCTATHIGHFKAAVEYRVE